jgi:hypothetical protein
MPASADSLTEVENARARERQGQYMNNRDREQLRRWGGSGGYDRHAYRPYDYGYYDRYDDGPDLLVYVEPY